MRCAEKNRKSTCKFADRIARICLAEYERVKEEEKELRHTQTVFAAFVLREMESSSVDVLRVISCGVGTKFIDVPNLSPTIVRDCHAEILARRCLLLFFRQQIALARSASPSIFVPSTDSSIDLARTDAKYVLSSRYSIHFYSSSSPCGNSCIKRWVAGGKGPVYPDLDDHSLPE